ARDDGHDDARRDGQTVCSWRHRDADRTGWRCGAHGERCRGVRRILSLRDPHGAARPVAAALRERGSMTRRAAIIVLDGVGIGAAPDAAAYGDVGSNTLGNLARSVGGMRLPNLERAGLGLIAPLAGVAQVAN